MDLDPLKMIGASGGLKRTMTPGAGSLNSCAWTKGRGPKVLARKANRINMWVNGARTIAYKVCTIFRLKTRLEAISRSHAGYPVFNPSFLL